ncbi:putative phosphatase regulatory subunit-domain-containing protein [Tricharina praecox]|uniref:putative phosphatase regulatory subunit-domain-containing protein n=1 Tax=Tricharina praecox TaxID=43433 RepID=UPI0022200046|nr:putative phosphatase regulatory subunit-domain-containing protein [Tricharina praecox]KAI5843241.1 putative phosphatase regulatory subunit-domain-containing protein [Tricharina praecox]
MPYTPPVQTPSASPCSSRSSSFSNHDPQSRSTLNFLQSSNPPRSATYLHKQRRSSSGSLPIPLLSTPQSPSTKEQQPSTDPRMSGSVHQSPPPVDNGLSVMPAGAIMSPPDSTQNSSDEEDGGLRRGRDLGKLEDELKEAIMRIPQRRFPSPERTAASVEIAAATAAAAAAALSPRARNQHSHHYRSRSDTSSMLIDIAATRPRSGSNSGSVSDFEDDYRIAPPMVRKKSGEVVKSSLKSPSRSRPCSVPATPTFPKNVHFDARIEHVRHFLHSEKPSAVSVGSSPVEGVYDGESEYPFGYDDDEPQWEIGLPNFPKDHESRKALPVRLEKLCLSTDKKNLIGTVAVSNLSFQKHVVARFTFDYWQTVSEVSADYSSDVRRREREDGIDRFIFKIKLAEQANLEKKILFFCIRYVANGQEHWDNNGGVNFQVDFKKAFPTRPHAGHQASALPRSSKPSTPSSRPRTIPHMDDFELLDDAFFAKVNKLDRPRSKKSKPVTVDQETELPSRRANPTGNAFGNRYDFRASLNQTIKMTSSASAPGLVRTDKVSFAEADTTPPRMDNSYFNLPMQRLSSELPSTTTPLDSPSISGAGPPEIFNTDNFWTHEDKPSIESPSYRELLDNYCFFGSAKATKLPLSKPEPPKKSESKPKESVQIVLPTGEKRSVSPPQYMASPLNGTSITPPSLSVAQQKSTGNASPIPANYAGYHHRRRGSGAFRFDTSTQTPAIC